MPALLSSYHRHATRSASPEDFADPLLYEWTGRTTEYHRAQIRQHLGFQECSTADADKLTAWLAEQVAQAERRPDRVRQELLARCRTERIEPPAAQRIDRIVRSALHQAEQMLSLRIASRLAAQVARRLEALVVVDDDEDGDGRGVLALVKSVPGNVSLETMLTEIGKLEAVRAVGLPPDLFADVAQGSWPHGGPAPRWRPPRTCAHTRRRCG